MLLLVFIFSNDSYALFARSTEGSRRRTWLLYALAAFIALVAFPVVAKFRALGRSDPTLTESNVGIAERTVRQAAIFSEAVTDTLEADATASDVGSQVGERMSSLSSLS